MNRSTAPQENRPRTIRVSDELWDEAQRACEWRREPSLSFVIRRMLHRYVEQTEKVKREHEAQQRGGAR